MDVLTPWSSGSRPVSGAVRFGFFAVPMVTFLPFRRLTSWVGCCCPRRWRSLIFYQSISPSTMLAPHCPVSLSARRRVPSWKMPPSVYPPALIDGTPSVMTFSLSSIFIPGTTFQPPFQTRLTSSFSLMLFTPINSTNKSGFCTAVELKPDWSLFSVV